MKKEEWARQDCIIIHNYAFFHGKSYIIQGSNSSTDGVQPLHSLVHLQIALCYCNISLSLVIWGSIAAKCYYITYYYNYIKDINI